MQLDILSFFNQAVLDFLSKLWYNIVTVKHRKVKGGISMKKAYTLMKLYENTPKAQKMRSR